MDLGLESVAVGLLCGELLQQLLDGGDLLVDSVLLRVGVGQPAEIECAFVDAQGPLLSPLHSKITVRWHNCMIAPALRPQALCPLATHQTLPNPHLVKGAVLLNVSRNASGVRSVSLEGERELEGGSGRSVVFLACMGSAPAAKKLLDCLSGSAQRESSSEGSEDWGELNLVGGWSSKGKLVYLLAADPSSPCLPLITNLCCGVVLLPCSTNPPSVLVRQAVSNWTHLLPRCWLLFQDRLTVGRQTLAQLRTAFKEVHLGKVQTPQLLETFAEGNSWVRGEWAAEALRAALTSESPVADNSHLLRKVYELRVRTAQKQFSAFLEGEPAWERLEQGRREVFVPFNAYNL